MTNQTSSPDATKISVSVYPALLARFEKSLRPIIKRDAFLGQLIAQELPWLRAELEGRKNSDAARRYIGRRLRGLKPETINVLVEKSLAAELAKVVEESNLSRDAFFNYLLFCLEPTPMFFRYFELPDQIAPSNFKEWLQPMPVAPMATIKEVLSDPFYYLRAAVRERWQQGLYTLELPEKMHGFSCYLPDESVPRTKANKKAQRDSEQLFAELERLDAEAFGTAAAGQQ